MSKADKFYIIEEILKERTRKGNVEYFVKWKGYSSKTNSWVPSNWMIDLPKKQQKPKKPTTEGVRQSITGRISKAKNRPTTTRKSTKSALIATTPKTKTKGIRQSTTSRISKANNRPTTTRKSTKSALIASTAKTNTLTTDARPKNSSGAGSISKANDRRTAAKTNSPAGDSRRTTKTRIIIPASIASTAKANTKGVRQSTTSRISKANNRPTTMRKSTKSALIASTANTNTDARSTSSSATSGISKANDRRTMVATNSSSGDPRLITKRRTIIVPNFVLQATKSTASKRSSKLTPSTNKSQKLYQIEQILARRIINSKVEYLVHWKGYSRIESTWEAEGPLKSDYCQMYCHSLRLAFLD